MIIFPRSMDPLPAHIIHSNTEYFLLDLWMIFMCSIPSANYFLTSHRAQKFEVRQD
jgi:hypothetical protein